MKFTDQDVDIVARLILGEATGQSYLGKVAVASTVANRAAINYNGWG